MTGVSPGVLRGCLRLEVLPRLKIAANGSVGQKGEETSSLSCLEAAEARVLELIE